ncbi:MAG: DNA lyase [bacterium]
MRLWSIHPCYLDARGLVALWREALLARSVILGKTKGYLNHPQLIRFRAFQNPANAINRYLWHVCEEAGKRGYEFDQSKLEGKARCRKIKVTTGQIEYEFGHLLRKLASRAPDIYAGLKTTGEIRTHPLFIPVPGPVEEWEKVHGQLARNPAALRPNKK